MEAITSTFLQFSWQPSSVLTCRRARKLYQQLTHETLQGAPVSLPITSTDLSKFIVFLFQRKYASSAVLKYVSALRYCHPLADYPDPSKTFCIVQILKSYKNKGIRIDSRLPITLPLIPNIRH